MGASHNTLDNLTRHGGCRNKINAAIVKAVSNPKALSTTELFYSNIVLSKYHFIAVALYYLCTPPAEVKKNCLTPRDQFTWIGDSKLPEPSSRSLESNPNYVRSKDPAWHAKKTGPGKFTNSNTQFEKECSSEFPLTAQSRQTQIADYV